MKKRLIRFLYWLLLKIEGKKPFFQIPPEVYSLIPEAVRICSDHEVGQSGEWRRHQVLSKLMKRGASERDAALAIELAIRGIAP